MAAEIGVEIGEEFGDGFKVVKRSPPAPLKKGGGRVGCVVLLMKRSPPAPLKKGGERVFKSPFLRGI